MFKIGDKVRCIDVRDNLNTQKIYTVIECLTGGFGEALVKVKEERYTSYYAERFVHADLDYATTTPVIRKIREMEKRRRVSYAAI